MERYSRQLLLKDFGPLAQRKIMNASVLVIGAGGLGCPVLLYLAAAGVGTLGMADGDRVELSNLPRQVLFGTNDIGLPKVEVAARKLKEANDDVSLKIYNCFIGKVNVLEVIRDYDVIVDACDNFATRYLLSDVCFLLNKTLVYGAVSGYEGQIAVFGPSEGRSAATYRDLYPVPPAAHEVNSCTEEGILGVIPGMTGVLQASEIIKIITGTGSALLNKVLTIDFTDYRMQVTSIPATNNNGVPSSIHAMLKYEYDIFCSSAPPLAENEITYNEFENLKKEEEWTLIDLRRDDEVSGDVGVVGLHIPFENLEQILPGLPLRNQVLFICASGARSAKALAWAQPLFPDTRMFSLKGGWKAVPDNKLSII